ncbi:MAG: Formate dehydrogenase [Methanomicrobiales archaeon 53_19]|jgi:FdhD protein|uniref:formate dehydrogenase accessory sulfurtransferase FdhD n=1 Tax=Methanocalculus sp. TaxID=2004547 RepID=UPI00074A4290|nr:formate dehydrogenase accessory sulfurtransferase FdhD [Methanocalculus sp.]KUK69595.1 MAG: Formate dehydrogenase [Methanocalculus sp. 52_23]KUL04582.1 MAG: Formate dehydrogenase [Methanomicrobiales archaeon 53_19]HIJ06804.1 formate dehydrogenase accessory sulfurtransferase FdhD [Methanocalculus sp.]
MPHTDFSSLPCLLLDERERLESTEGVSQETVIALFVNGRHAETAILSPGSLEEYTIGFLFSEEIIRSKDDIESIRIEENRISVLTTNPFRITGRRKTVLAGCGGSTSYIDTTSLPRIRDGSNPISLPVIREIISHLPGGKESAILIDRDGGIIASFHDIGCSPAVDRVIGYGLLNNLDFSGTVLGISGRITSEMVRRCLLAGIPIVVSTGQVTDLAARIADETNLCIISHTRDGRPACFSHPERIRGSV